MGKVSREVEEVHAGTVHTIFVDLENIPSAHEHVEGQGRQLTKCEATQLENKAR